MICKDCAVELPKSCKPNKSGRCFKCRRIAAKASKCLETKIYQAEYRAKNREKRNTEKKLWYQANKSHKLKKDKEYREADPNRHRKMQNACKKRQYANDIQYKLRKLLRASLRRGLFDSSKSILSLIDCTIEEMKLHIESQFTPEMTWKNHGKIWHIDHIKPLCAFNLTNELEIKEATKRDNLRPMLISEHLKKSTEDRKWKK